MRKESSPKFCCLETENQISHLCYNFSAPFRCQQVHTSARYAACPGKTRRYTASLIFHHGPPLYGVTDTTRYTHSALPVTVPSTDAVSHSAVTIQASPQAHPWPNPLLCTCDGSTRPRIASHYSCQTPSELGPSCSQSPYLSMWASGWWKTAQQLATCNLRQESTIQPRGGPPGEQTHLPHLAHLRHGFFLGAGPSSPSSPILRLLAGTSWASASNCCAESSKMSTIRNDCGESTGNPKGLAPRCSNAVVLKTSAARVGASED